MRRWYRAPILLAVFLSACNAEKSVPTQGEENNRTVINVIDDPAEIEAARRADVDRCNQRFAELVANPACIYSFETEDMTLLRARQEEAVVMLTALRDDDAKPAQVRVQAIVALNLLGVPPSPDRLAELALYDPKAKLGMLLHLNDLFPIGELLPPTIAQLVAAGLDDQDPVMLRTTAMLAAQYNVVEASDRILARLEREAGQNSDSLLDAAARLCPTRKVIELLVPRLNESADTFGPPQALDSLAEAARATSDIDARVVAVTAITKYLVAQPDQKWIDSSTISAVEAIAELPTPASVQALEELARNMKWWAARDCVLTELSKLDPDLAKLVAGQIDAQLDVNQPTAAAVDLTVTSRAITADQAADICVRHGFLDRAESNRILAKIRNSLEPSTSEDEWPAGDTALGFLGAADRFYAFDAETGMVPNRHDLLILDIAENSAGRFKPEAVLEAYRADRPDGHTGQYQVQFIHYEHLYRFRPIDLGDWYDVGAVLAAINRALADADERQRFVLLESDGQVVNLVFGDPHAVRAAAGELGLALDDDPDSARRQGQAFETQVLQSLDGD